MSNIGQKIKELRLQRGWSQEKLAEKIGIGQQYISKYESGKLSPSFKTLSKIADVLGVSVDFLRTKEKVDLSNVNVQDKNLRELLNEVNDLNEEDLFTIKNVIEALVYRNKNKD